eukprot:4385244-Pyramimonas_sp.AAC.1
MAPAPWVCGTLGTTALLPHPVRWHNVALRLHDTPYLPWASPLAYKASPRVLPLEAGVRRA